MYSMVTIKILPWGFPGGAVVRIWCFTAGGLGSIPAQGTKIPQAAWCSQKTKKQLILYIDLVSSTFNHKLSNLAELVYLVLIAFWWIL